MPAIKAAYGLVSSVQTSESVSDSLIQAKDDQSQQLRLDLEAPPFKPLRPAPKGLLMKLSRKTENPEDADDEPPVAIKEIKQEESKLPILEREQEVKIAKTVASGLPKLSRPNK